MGESDYATYLEERYQGEVFGEAVFGAMADVTTHPERARKLRLLEQLERETKELLYPAVRETGGSLELDAARVAEARQAGARLGRSPWLDIVRGMQPEISKFVVAFEGAESLAPAGSEALLRRVTDHERALLDFATRELASPDGGDSTAPVEALLGTAPE